MKLLLTSEGVTNPSIAKALLALLGKPSSAVQMVDHAITVISEGVWKKFN